MLDRVDRIQMAVAEATPVARAFQDILGAELAREDESDYLKGSSPTSSPARPSASGW